LSRVKKPIRFAWVAVILVFCLSLAGCGPFWASEGKSSQDDAGVQKALQPLVEQWRTANGVPGVALVVSPAEGDPVTVAVGIADLETEKRMTGKELFDAGSITQTFVAAALLQLVDEGRLDLDEVVGRYLPDFPPGARITVRQVLSHSSGLPELRDDPEVFQQFFREPGHRWTLSELLAIAAAMPAYFEPGASFRDTDTDYIVAAAILEEVTGSDLATELRQRFFKPLGLNDTFVAGLEEARRPFMSGYLPCGHALAPSILALHSGRVFCQWGGIDLDRMPKFQEATFNLGASGVVSTPTDLLRWARALYAGQVLSPAGQQEMLTFDVSRSSHGLGAMQFVPPTGDVAWGRLGGALGVESILLYSPAQDIALLAFSNAGDVGDLTFLTDSVLNALAGLETADGPGEQALEELVAELEDADPAVRREAAAALGRKGAAAAGAAPSLIRLLADDPDWQVRQAAATALGWTGPASLVEDPLRAAALNDPHERVQWSAQLALSVLEK
jgi:D-alanyl-D-alanine carboxypeptidase